MNSGDFSFKTQNLIGGISTKNITKIRIFYNLLIFFLRQVILVLLEYLALQYNCWHQAHRTPAQNKLHKKPPQS